MRYEERRDSPSKRSSRSHAEAKNRYYPTRGDDRFDDDARDSKYSSPRDRSKSRRRGSDYSRHDSPMRRQDSRDDDYHRDSYRHKSRPRNSRDDRDERKVEHKRDLRDESDEYTPVRRRDSRRDDSPESVRDRRSSRAINYHDDSDEYERKRHSPRARRNRDDSDDITADDESAYKGRHYSDYSSEEDARYTDRKTKPYHRDERQERDSEEYSGENTPAPDSTEESDAHSSPDEQERPYKEKTASSKHKKRSNWDHLADLYDEVFSGRSVSKSRSSYDSSSSVSSYEEDDEHVHTNCMNTLFSKDAEKSGINFIRSEKEGRPSTEVQLRMTLPLPSQLMNNLEDLVPSNLEDLVPTKSEVEKALDNFRTKSTKIAKKCELDYNRLEEQVILDEEFPGGVMPQFYKSLFEDQSDGTSDDMEEKKVTGKSRVQESAKQINSTRGSPAEFSGRGDEGHTSFPTHIVIDTNASFVSSQGSLENPFMEMTAPKTLNLHVRSPANKSTHGDFAEPVSRRSPRQARPADRRGLDEFMGLKDSEEPSFEGALSRAKLHSPKKKDTLAKFNNRSQRNSPKGRDWIPAKREQLDLVDQDYPSFDAPDDRNHRNNQETPKKQKRQLMHVDGIPSSIDCTSGSSEIEEESIGSALTGDEVFDTERYPVVRPLSLSENDEEEPSHIPPVSKFRHVVHSGDELMARNRGSSPVAGNVKARDDTLAISSGDELMVSRRNLPKEKEMENVRKWQEPQSSATHGHLDEADEFMRPHDRRMNEKKSIGRTTNSREDKFTSSRTNKFTEDEFMLPRDELMGSRLAKRAVEDNSERASERGDELMRRPTARSNFSERDVEQGDELMGSRDELILGGDELMESKVKEDTVIIKSLDENLSSAMASRSKLRANRFSIGSLEEGDELMARRTKVSVARSTVDVDGEKGSIHSSGRDSRFAEDEDVPMDEAKQSRPPSRAESQNASKASGQPSTHSDPLLQAKEEELAFDERYQPGTAVSRATTPNTKNKEADCSDDFEARMKSAAAARLDSLDVQTRQRSPSSVEKKHGPSEKRSEGSNNRAIDPEMLVDEHFSNKTPNVPSSENDIEFGQVRADDPDTSIQEKSNHQPMGSMVDTFTKYYKQLTEWDEEKEIEKHDEGEHHLETVPEVDSNADSSSRPSNEDERFETQTQSGYSRTKLLSEIDVRSQAVEINYIGDLQNGSVAEPSVASARPPLVIAPTSATMETPLTFANTSYTMDTPVGSPPHGRQNQTSRKSWDLRSHQKVASEAHGDFYGYVEEEESDYVFDERLAKLSALRPVSLMKEKPIKFSVFKAFLGWTTSFVTLYVFILAWLRHVVFLRFLLGKGRSNEGTTFKRLQERGDIQPIASHFIQGKRALHRDYDVDDEDGTGTVVESVIPEVHNPHMHDQDTWTVSSNTSRRSWRPKIRAKAFSSGMRKYSGADDARSIASMQGWSTQRESTDFTFREE